MLLAMFHKLQIESKIQYENTYLGRLFFSIKHNNEDIIQVFLAVETGIAAIAIALLTITTKSWDSLKFSTLQDMRREAEKQDNLFGIMWILSLISSALATLSVATAVIKQYSPIDCLFTFFIVSMALIVVVLPSLLRYEGVGYVKIYSHSLSTLIDATNFADSIGLKLRCAPRDRIEKNTPTRKFHSLLTTPALKFHSLFAIPALILALSTFMIYRFSVDALAVIYVALICVISLWIVVHNTIKFSASKERQYLTLPSFAVLLFFALASIIIYLQYHWLDSKVAENPEVTTTFLIFNVITLSLTVAISISFIRKRRTLWRFRIIKLSYASEVTSLLTYTRSIRNSLKKIPKEIRPTKQSLHKWIECELNTSSRLRKTLQSKKDWVMGEKSSNQLSPKKRRDKESNVSPEENNGNVVILQIFTRSILSAPSTRQRQQGRAGNVRRLRK